MKFIIFLVLPWLIVSASAESTDSINKNKNAESTKDQNQIAYMPVDKLDNFNNYNPVHHPYPFFNIAPIAKDPQQQHPQHSNFFVPRPAQKFFSPQYSNNNQGFFPQTEQFLSKLATPQQQDYYPNSYPQHSNFFVPRPAQKFFSPQYSNNNQGFFPQTEQFLSKPATFLSIPYDIGMRGLGFISKMLDNVHQGINSFTGYLPENKGFLYPRYETGNIIPVENELTNKNWLVEQGIKFFTGYTPQNKGWLYPRYGPRNSIPVENELTNKNWLVDQGIQFFTGNTPQNKGWLYPRYEPRNSVPVGNENTNKKWLVEYNYPNYNHGENERYNPNLEKNHQSLYPPGKSSVYEYANANGYPRWLVPNQQVNY